MDFQISLQYWLWNRRNLPHSTQNQLFVLDSLKRRRTRCTLTRHTSRQFKLNSWYQKTIHVRKKLENHSPFRPASSDFSLLISTSQNSEFPPRVASISVPFSLYETQFSSHVASQLAKVCIIHGQRIFEKVFHFNFQ